MTGRVKLVSVALLLTVVAGGCGRTPGDANPPWCDDFAVLVLAAQSAPTAQLIPCLDAMPLGWSVDETHINERGTVFTLDSTIAGNDAARVELRENCDTNGYVEVPSDVVGAARFEFVDSIESGFRGRRVYTFDGGCTSIDLDFDVDVSAALVSEVSIALGYVTRDEVNDAIRLITDGREQVDPTVED